jgi:alpha-1,2-mannosyltransferase
MRTEGLRVLVGRAIYSVCLIGAVAWAFLILNAAAANGQLGYDFKAYDLAVDNLLAGQSMYDTTVTSMGAFGLFFYPPPFALLILPFALLPEGIGVLVWTLALVTASVSAIALLPVSPRTRYIVLLLAALSWPLVYAIKLGQVGSVLLLLFAIAWRGIDRPAPFGLATGIGTVIKLQPGLVIGWAIVTGRRTAAMIGIAVFAVLALLITLVAGTQPWSDWLAVLGNVSRPVLAENDMGVGRQAYLAGVPLAAAQGLHYVNVAVVILVTFVASLRATPIASFMAVVVASQFVSPVLWDHYALLLLLPVAWLIDRGYVWAAVIPFVTSTVLVGITPGMAYPILFWVTLLAVTWAGLRDRGAAMQRARTMAA